MAKNQVRKSDGMVRCTAKGGPLDGMTLNSYPPHTEQFQLRDLPYRDKGLYRRVGQPPDHEYRWVPYEKLQEEWKQ